MSLDRFRLVLLAAACFVATGGPVEAQGARYLYVWAADEDQADTDFLATLQRRERSGALRQVAVGIQRVRYRKGNHIDAPVEAGEVVELTIDCWATGVRFEKGDALVLQISSSGFPGYARNLNTLEPQATATKPRVALNTVYHDAARPSHILLPVIPREGTHGLEFAKK